MITTLAVRGYRSLRDVVVPLGPLTVVTGANGTGKSSLFKAIDLIADAARGRLVGSLARAGGLPSVLWAGPEHITGAMRRGEVEVQGTGGRVAPLSLSLGFASTELGYVLDVGLPQRGPSTLFFRDPHIKREQIFAGDTPRPATTLIERNRGLVRWRDGAAWTPSALALEPHESLLDEAASAESYPEVAQVRRLVCSWRLYDSFRVDADAPARVPQPGTRTPALAADGRDLASAVGTIAESAWSEPFEQAIADAFDGARVGVREELGRLGLTMRQPGMLRELEAAEWSDGTLRYVLLAAALCAVTPGALVALNEPEASLHPDLIAPLARLIIAASGRTQVVVITHSRALAGELAQADPVEHELVKSLGETCVEGQGLLSRPAWRWPQR